MCSSDLEHADASHQTFKDALVYFRGVFAGRSDAFELG